MWVGAAPIPTSGHRARTWALVTPQQLFPPGLPASLLPPLRKQPLLDQAPCHGLRETAETTVPTDTGGRQAALQTVPACLFG